MHVSVGAAPLWWRSVRWCSPLPLRSPWVQGGRRTRRTGCPWKARELQGAIQGEPVSCSEDGARRRARGRVARGGRHREAVRRRAARTGLGAAGRVLGGVRRLEVAERGTGVVAGGHDGAVQLRRHPLQGLLLQLRSRFGLRQWSAAGRGRRPGHGVRLRGGRGRWCDAVEVGHRRMGADQRRHPRLGQRRPRGHRRHALVRHRRCGYRFDDVRGQRRLRHEPDRDVHRASKVGGNGAGRRHDPVDRQVRQTGSTSPARTACGRTSPT